MELLRLFVRRKTKCAACPRGLEWSRMMVDRQFVGDVALALLVAIPTATLAQPEPVQRRHASLSAPAGKLAPALASAADRQIGLYR